MLSSLSFFAHQQFRGFAGQGSKRKRQDYVRMCLPPGDAIFIHYRDGHAMKQTHVCTYGLNPLRPRKPSHNREVMR